MCLSVPPNNQNTHTMKIFGFSSTKTEAVSVFYVKILYIRILQHIACMNIYMWCRWSVYDRPAKKIIIIFPQIKNAKVDRSSVPKQCQTGRVQRCGACKNKSKQLDSFLNCKILSFRREFTTKPLIFFSTNFIIRFYLNHFLI